MINSLKPYPAMKDSGVEWLRDAPEHWDTSKIKGLARPGYKTFVDGDWIESPYITTDGIRLIQTGNIGTGEYREKGFRYISEETFTNFCCTEIKPGDILICRLGEPVSRACLAPQLGKRMITSVDVCILKARENIHAKFLVYSMSSWPYLDWVGSLVRGSTRDRVSRSMLGSFLLPIPPLAEQAAIVRFLDHADRRIRRYIRAKQQLIALLEEQKQAIIHRAVTRGLDPNVRLKPSGVEWLGDVPEHWRLPRLGALLRERGETNGDGQVSEVLSVLRERGVIPYAEKGNIGNKKSEDITRYKVVRPDDIVVNCMNVIIGSVGLSRYTGCLSPVYYVLTRRSERDRPRYLNAYFQTKPFQESLVRIGNGILAHRMRIPMELLKCEPFPRPPFEEQAAIVSFLDRATADLDAATTSAQRETSLLREYRTRLIADVVTGKLDVREAAARLPDEVEELEPLDEADALIDGEEEPTDALATVP